MLFKQNFNDFSHLLSIRCYFKRQITHMIFLCLSLSHLSTLELTSVFYIFEIGHFISEIALKRTYYIDMIGNPFKIKKHEPNKAVLGILNKQGKFGHATTR